MASWVNGYNPNSITDRIEQTKIISSNRKVSFRGFEHSQYVVLLNSMVNLDQQVPEVEKRRIINQSTFIAGAKGIITSKSILNEITKLERAYLLMPEQRFQLHTEISI